VTVQQICLVTLGWHANFKLRLIRSSLLRSFLFTSALKVNYLFSFEECRLSQQKVTFMFLRLFCSLCAGFREGEGFWKCDHRGISVVLHPFRWGYIIFGTGPFGQGTSSASLWSIFNLFQYQSDLVMTSLFLLRKPKWMEIRVLCGIVYFTVKHTPTFLHLWHTVIQSDIQSGLECSTYRLESTLLTQTDCKGSRQKTRNPSSFPRHDPSGFRRECRDRMWVSEFQRHYKRLQIDSVLMSSHRCSFFACPERSASFLAFDGIAWARFVVL